MLNEAYWDENMTDALSTKTLKHFQGFFFLFSRGFYVFIAVFLFLIIDRNAFGVKSYK